MATGEQNDCPGWAQEAFLGERIEHFGFPFGSIMDKNRHVM